MSEIITIEVAEAIGNNSAVYVSDVGEAYNAALPDKPATGFCRTGASDGAIQVFLSGLVPLPVEGLPGNIVYLDNVTPGEITALKPSGTVQKIGRISDGDYMLLDISQPEQLNAAAFAFFK